MRHLLGWKTSLLALFIAGCAGAPVPHDRMASSQAAIRAAEEVGARNQPQAELYLRLAREQVGQAEALIREGENERARMVLLRAEADAELALAMAKETSARADAQQAMEQVRLLRAKTP